MPVPSWMRDVAAAAYARTGTGSIISERDGRGDGGACGSMRTGCSPTQIESKPSDSAVCATVTTPSASASAPDPTPNQPIGSIRYAVRRRRSRRACALPTWVMMSTTNAKITMNHPKPVTPRIGA